MGHQSLLAALGLSLGLSACAQLYSHTNLESWKDPAVTTKATFNVSPARGDPDTLMILAFSGGGSRAAYWSASVMFELEKVFSPEVNLLAEVDAISSVSGGSLPAAYYGITRDKGDKDLPHYGRVWKEKDVKRLMSTDFVSKWIGNWFWPDNIAKFWLTSFDRTDIMAETFANILYDNTLDGGEDLLMGDLLPGRPYLILNATDGTTGHFGSPFTFTEEDFSSIRSEIGSYSLARAVMATATFPALFNYMTLRDFTHDSEDPSDLRFRHVFDGGPYDNLGLMSVIAILERMKAENTQYDRLAVILVDAYAKNISVDADEADPRDVIDYFVDSNAIGATDSLLSTNREHTLNVFKSEFLKYGKEKESVFYHLTFDSIPEADTRKAAQRIPTDFKLDLPADAETLDAAAAQLLTSDNPCLQAIRDLVAGNTIPISRQICDWPGTIATETPRTAPTD
jgi:predicted acylesterase/phospholipase RssA